MTLASLKSAWLRTLASALVLFCQAAPTLASEKAAQGEHGSEDEVVEPAFSEPSGLTPAGEWEVESGLALDCESAYSERRCLGLAGTPQLTLGLSRRLEFRMQGDGARFSSTAEENHASRAGSQKGPLGTKIGVFEDKGWRPSFSAMPLTVAAAGLEPSYERHFRSRRETGWQKSLPASLTVGGNVDAFLTSEDHDHEGRTRTPAYSLFAARNILPNLGALERRRRRPAGRPRATRVQRRASSRRP